jgi:hypothetical protein
LLPFFIHAYIDFNKIAHPIWTTLFSVVQFMMLDAPPHFLLHTNIALLLDVKELQTWFTEM